MRPLILLLIALAPLSALAEETTDLRVFADKYWAAIQSGDADRIFACYDPGVLGHLTPEERDFMKAAWMHSYKSITAKRGNAYEINVFPLPAETEIGPELRWSSEPEYQVEIHLFERDGDQRTGLGSIVDMAVRRGERFYIVRPVMPEKKLKLYLENAKKKQQPEVSE